MIKCSRGNVEVSGTKVDLSSELSTIVFAFKERKIFTEEELREAFEDGLKDVGEIRRETIEKLMSIIFGDFKKEDKHD